MSSSPTTHHPLPPQKHQSELELLSLQHEIRDKNQQIRKISLRYAQLETQFKSILQNHRTMLNHLQDLKAQIENERERNRNLSKENQKVQLEILAIQATNAKIDEYKDEIAALKKMNANLEQAIMEQRELDDSKQIQSFKNKIKVLKEEYAKFEITSRKQFQKYEQAEKTIISQKEQIKKLKQRISDLTIELKTLTNENESLKERMHSRKDDEHAIKQKLNQHQQILIHKDQKIKNLNDTIRQLQEQQSKLKSRCSDLESQCNDEKNKNVQMQLDLQNALLQQQQQPRIESPPSPLYRKPQPRLDTPPPPPSDTDSQSSEEPYNFNISHNTFHILIKRLSFDLQNYPFESFLPTFISVDFFEFKTELTEIMRPNEHGVIPFDTTIICRNLLMSKYLIYYLCCDSLIFDVHLESDGDGTRIGTCVIPLVKLLEGQDRLEGSIPIRATPNVAESMSSARSSSEASVIGTVDFEVYFETPLREAITDSVDIQAIQSMRNTKQIVNISNAEEYHIEVVSARNLPAASEHAHSKPSPFVCYKFFHFEIHSTPVVSSTNNPKFDDEQLFPIQKNDNFTEYLRESHMDLVVCDSAHDDRVIGVCSLPLYKLLVREELQETLQLKHEKSDKPVGRDCELVVRIRRKHIAQHGSQRE